MKLPFKTFLALLSLAIFHQASAQSSIWINNAAGTWSDTSQWSSGVVADGAGNTADFSTVNLSAARTVTMDASHTLGSLLFSDTASAFFGWTIAPSDGTILLTLNNGGNSPVLATTNATDVLSVPLAGTQGFTKIGPSQLTLSAIETNLLGDIVINGGTLLLNTISVAPGSTNQNLTKLNNLVFGGGIFNLNDAANTGHTMQEFSNITVNAGQSFMGQSRGANAFGQYQFDGSFFRSAGGTLDLPNYDVSRTLTYATNASVPPGIVLSSGVAYLTGNGFADWAGKATNGVAAATNSVGNGNGSITFTASTATTLSGNANITTTNGTTLALNTGITSLKYVLASNTVVNLGGFNLTNGGTLLSGAVTAGNGLTITNGVLLPPPNQDVVIIQNGAGTLTVAATIADNGTAAGLTKSAAGLLVLSGNNTYSGTTYLNAGTIQVGNGGTSGDLGSSPLVRGQAGNLVFNRSDSPSYGGSLSGPISLTKQGAGTLTLTGNSTLSGLVTNAAGTLQIGNGGTSGSLSNALSMVNNGTVAFNRSSPLTYSGSISGSGAVINQGSSSVTLAGNISGLTASLANSGSGTLILGGSNTYGGNTVISSGTLILTSLASISNSPAIIVASGAKLDVSTLSSGSLNLNGALSVKQAIVGSGVVTGNVVTAGAAILSPATNGVIGTLSFSNNLTLNGGTLNFDITSSSTLDQIIVGGTLTINSGNFVINVTGSPIPNGAYTLVKYPAGAEVGSVANLSVSFSQAGSQADLDDSIPGQIRLIVSSATPNNLVWQGNLSGDWDLNTLNWLNGASAVNFSQHDNVTFNDTGITPSVNLAIVAKPTLVLVTNSANNYIFSTSTAGNRLTGGASLTKDGTGTLSLLELNDYSGSTTIKGGTVILGDNSANSGSFGSGNITNNGSIDINNADAQTIVAPISGTGSLTNDGTGTAILTANNTYTGDTAIKAGTLQIGLGASSGTLGSGSVINNSTLILNRSGTLTVNNTISGNGTLIVNGPGTVTLGAANTYVNNTYVSNGVVKLAIDQAIPSGGSTTGWLILDGGSTAGTFDLAGFNQTLNALSGVFGTVNGVITNSGTVATATNLLIVGTASANTYNGIIANSSSGSKTKLVLTGASSLRLNGNNTYTGGTAVGDTATLIFGPGALIGNGGSITMSNGTSFRLANNGSTSSNNGNTINTVDNATATFTSGQTANAYSGQFTGSALATNIYSGGAMSISGTLSFANFLGTVMFTGGGVRMGPGTGFMGGDNTTFIFTNNGSCFTRDAGTVRLGALLGDSTASITDPNNPNGTYWIGAKGIDSSFAGTIVGRNNIVKTGADTLTLSGTLSYTGFTTVSNGVLSLASDSTALDSSPTITLAGNTAVIDVSIRTDRTITLGNSVAQTLNGVGTIRGSLTELAGSVLNPGNTTGNITNGTGTGILNVTNVASVFGAVNMRLNRTNSINADELTAASFTIDPGATLTVTNVGPSFQGGEVFQLFNHPVSFATVTLPTVSSPLSLTNKLAIDGSIAILGSLVNTNSAPITFSFNGSTLSLSWPTDHLGWKLQIQTNALTTGISTNWVTLPGSELVTSTNMTVNPANGTVFYRMVYP